MQFNPQSFLKILTQSSPIQSMYGSNPGPTLVCGRVWIRCTGLLGSLEARQSPRKFGVKLADADIVGEAETGCRSLFVHLFRIIITARNVYKRLLWHDFSTAIFMFVVSFMFYAYVRFIAWFV